MRLSHRFRLGLFQYGLLHLAQRSGRALDSGSHSCEQREQTQTRRFLVGMVPLYTFSAANVKYFLTTYAPLVHS